MADGSWWSAWGQGAVAVLALLVAVWTRLDQWREHGWKRAEREQERRRRGWCEAQRDILLDTGGRELLVDDTYLRWVRWGEETGYFSAEELPGGRFRLSVPTDALAARRGAHGC